MKTTSAWLEAAWSRTKEWNTLTSCVAAEVRQNADLAVRRILVGATAEAAASRLLQILSERFGVTIGEIQPRDVAVDPVLRDADHDGVGLLDWRACAAVVRKRLGCDAAAGDSGVGGLAVGFVRHPNCGVNHPFDVLPALAHRVISRDRILQETVLFEQSGAGCGELHIGIAGVSRPVSDGCVDCGEIRDEPRPPRLRDTPHALVERPGQSSGSAGANLE